MDLRFNTMFHPQTNDQSERMIQMLENFLRPYVQRLESELDLELGIGEVCNKQCSQYGNLL